jgi:hypothetical protein
MQFFAVLFLAISLSSNIIFAMIPEELSHEAQEAAASKTIPLTTQEKLAIAEEKKSQKHLLNKKEEIKKALEDREKLRAQKKATARTTFAQKTAAVTKQPQFSMAIVSELLETTLFKDLPDVPKEQILRYFSKATTIEEIGNVLREISTGQLFRKYLTTPEFTAHWLQFAQQMAEENIKERTKGVWWDSNDGSPKKPMSEVRIYALRANEDDNLTIVQNRALLALGTDDALDRYIKTLDPDEIQSDARSAIEYIANPSLRVPLKKRYVPLLIRLLKKKRVNLNYPMLLHERRGNNVETISELPLTYVLRNENNDPYLVKLLLGANASAKGFIQGPLEAATKNINKNTLKNLNLLFAAGADARNGTGTAVRNLLNSADPASVQILGTLLDHKAPIAAADVRLANELLAAAVKHLPAIAPARVELQLKANLVNHYASAITRARAQVGL